MEKSSRRKNIFDIVWGFTVDMNAKNIGAFAGNAAFFWFLAMIPLLICLVSILPYTFITENVLLDMIGDIVPKAVEGYTLEIVHEIYAKNAGRITIFAIITIWSAAKGMMSLSVGLNVVNGYIEKRNYVLVRLIASFYTLLMLIGIIFGLFVSVFGKKIIYFIFRRTNFSMIISKLASARFVVTGVVLFFVFALAYTFLPAKNLKIKTQLPGAFFSSFVCVVLSWFFSMYIELFEGFSAYGSLATVTMLMFWFYMHMYMFFLGAEINRYIINNAKEGKPWAEKIIKKLSDK